MTQISTELLEEIKATVAAQEFELARLGSQALVHATVVRSDNKFDLKAFEQGDLLIVIDRELKRQKKFYGKVASKVGQDGWVIIEYPDLSRGRVNIGINCIPQVKLTAKNDGTNVTISFNGNLYEVHGLPSKQVHSGNIVKVNMETKQIHDLSDLTAAGDIAIVKAAVDKEHVEVEADGKSRVALCIGFAVEPADRVMMDQSNTMIVRVLEKAGKDKFNLTEQSNIRWSDIAGCYNAKANLIEAIEQPYKHPEVYKFYNKKLPKGVLLYGPPGCGKTLLAKATAKSLAETHGVDNYQSGFIYVKGPELLSKWVGHSEQQISELFARARQHYKEHKYPALMFIDEAEAILPMRGSGKSSDVENTIVPMFLSEMDGLEDSHVMVLLATNQPKRLDPAVVREGRVDRHVKVDRPDQFTASEYFDLHLKGVPFAKGHKKDHVVALVTAELFSKSRELFNIRSKSQDGTVVNHTFHLGNAVTGAMLAGICDQAASKAMQRDLVAGTRTGVTMDDFITAIDTIHKQRAEMNATFDIEDFCDENGIAVNNLQVSKVSVK